MFFIWNYFVFYGGGYFNIWVFFFFSLIVSYILLVGGVYLCFILGINIGYKLLKCYVSDGCESL